MVCLDMARPNNYTTNVINNLHFFFVYVKLLISKGEEIINVPTVFLAISKREEIVIVPNFFSFKTKLKKFGSVVFFLTNDKP